MATSGKSVTQGGRWRKRLLGGTSLYGFELVVAVIGLLVTAGVLIYGVYTLCNYLLGIDESTTRQLTGELPVWLMSAMIVWLPLTLFFYMRTRAEAIARPLREQATFHKFLVGAYRFVLLMTVIGLLFSVVYAAIRLMIGVEDNGGEVLRRVIVPGLLSTVIAGGCIVAYNRSHIPRYQLFSLILSILSVVLIVTVLSVSVGWLRDDAIDRRAVEDMNAMQQQITTYYSDNQTVPGSLTDLRNLSDETRGRLANYSYAMVSASRFRICATFLTDTMNGSDISVPVAAETSYSMYANFYMHEKGEQCYNVSTSYLDDGVTNSSKSIPSSSETGY